jgi:hypothetical protein
LLWFNLRLRPAIPGPSTPVRSDPQDFAWEMSLRNVDESRGSDYPRSTAQCLPTVSTADSWREIPFPQPISFRVMPQRLEFQRKQLHGESLAFHFDVQSANRGCGLACQL